MGERKEKETRQFRIIIKKNNSERQMRENKNGAVFIN